MGLKIRLSEYAREQLALHLGEPWFIEMLETLRNIAGSSEQSYTASRTITELEHQALNGSYRRGCICIVEAIPELAKEPIQPKKEMPPPFGSLVPDVPNPKALPIQKNPTDKK